MVIGDSIMLGARLRFDPIIFTHGYRCADYAKRREIALNYQTDCFVLTTGADEYKYPQLAARLSAETAIWGYKVIRTKSAIWGEKRILMRRIFRSVNLTLWQKHKEEEFSDLVVASLGVVILTGQTFWVGTAGAIWAYLLREGNPTRLNFPDINEEMQVTKALGLQKPVLIPQITNNKLKPGDTIVLASGGLINIIRDSKLTEVFGNMKKVTQKDLDIKVSEVLDEVDNKQSGLEMSLTVIHHTELYYK